MKIKRKPLKLTIYKSDGKCGNLTHPSKFSFLQKIFLKIYLYYLTKAKFLNSFLCVCVCVCVGFLLFLYYFSDAFILFNFCILLNIHCTYSYSFSFTLDKTPRRTRCLSNNLSLSLFYHPVFNFCHIPQYLLSGKGFLVRKLRISLGAESILSMCLCSHTQLNWNQKLLISRFFLYVRVSNRTIYQLPLALNALLNSSD